jgi:hypothetical protein
MPKQLDNLEQTYKPQYLNNCLKPPKPNKTNILRSSLIAKTLKQRNLEQPIRRASSVGHLSP